MENEKSTTSLLCRNGCGFFANDSYDGMCSKCYKDTVKRKQSSPVTPVTAPSSQAASPQLPVHMATGTTTMSSQPMPIPKAAQEQAVGGLAASPAGSVDSTDVGSPLGTSADKKKKTRCATCRKKVGLTGFECRCGGLYCSTHRYSDRHDCSFNYQEEGQDQIRKNNPVIVGEKVQKI